MANRIRLVSTAYGPPWGGIQGTGTTSTGIDLHKHPQQYVVAVDPNVIPLGTKLKIPHNPFGDPNIVFTAADTGGAIKGKRLDFYDWRGRKAQMGWGTRPIDVELLGKGGKVQGGQSAAGGSPPTYIPGSSGTPDNSNTADLASMISSLMQPTMRPASAGVTPPSFSAAPVLPKGYQGIRSLGGPVPKPDIGQAIQQILPALAGGGMPQSPTPGIVIPGQAGGTGPSGGQLVHGAVAGSPIAGEKPHAPTHPTAGLAGYPAFDYMAKAGTPVVAPVTGKVLRFGHDHDPNQPPPQGPHGPFGRSVYIQGNDGRIYYLTHLGSRNVKIGQTVKVGQEIGTVGNYARWGGADHVHMGVHG